MEEKQNIRNERELGEHDERLKSLEREMSEIRSDLKLVLMELHQAKGGWKTLMLISGAAGAAGAILGKFIPFFVKP